MISALRRLVLTGLMIGPILAVGLLSLSPSRGVDFFARPGDASLRWWRLLLTDESWRAAVATSMGIAALSATVGIAVVAPVVIIGRIAGWRFSNALFQLAGLAILLPAVVVAVGLYPLFQVLGLFDTAWGLSLAHLSVTVPVGGYILFERFRSASLAGYQVARGLGASPISATLTWLSAEHGPSFAAAAMAAVMGSLSEATLTVFLTDTQVVTVARRALSGLSQDFDPTCYAAMIIWICTVALIVAPFRRN